MSFSCNEGLKKILNSPDTVTVLATINGDGTPHAAVLDSIRLTEDGTLEYLELLESAQSYRNLTASLWFNKTVSLLVATPDGTRYLITGRLVKISISGSYFEECYARIREKLGDMDLAAVCFIKILDVVDETLAVRFARQEVERPFYKHLDRLAKP
ncbi:MAG: pyridoxamine 5'-phosphate oxidase family protein [Desulfuromonadaceae bacterium]